MGKVGLDPRPFIEKGQRSPPGRQIVAQAHAIRLRLIGDATERRADSLGFDDAQRFAVDKKEVVRKSRLQRVLAPRDPRTGT